MAVPPAVIGRTRSGLVAVRQFDDSRQRLRGLTDRQVAHVDVLSAHFPETADGPGADQLGARAALELSD